MTILLGFAAVNTGNNLLFLVVSGLLGFMAVTGFSGMLNIRQVVPVLVPPEELYAGVPAVCRLEVVNRKRLLPSFLISVSSSSSATLVPYLAAGTAVQTTLQVSFETRGRHSVGLIRVSSPFPVGFFTRYWEFSLSDQCVVFPRPVPFAVRSAHAGGRQTGQVSRTLRGTDGELEGIREYSGSEPLKAIHWKLSARDRELLIKEFGSQTAEPLMIRLEELSGGNLEERLSQAAWLIREQGRLRPIGLELQGRTFSPASGRRHCLALLTELALYDQQ